AAALLFPLRHRLMGPRPPPFAHCLDEEPRPFLNDPRPPIAGDPTDQLPLGPAGDRHQRRNPPDRVVEMATTAELETLETRYLIVLTIKNASVRVMMRIRSGLTSAPIRTM